LRPDPPAEIIFADNEGGSLRPHFASSDRAWKCDALKAIWMKTARMKTAWMKAALLVAIFVASVSPVWATPYRPHQESDQPRWGWTSTINCETVRAYVAQVGLVQASALARAAGMTAWQEWRARRCLTKKN
jgi:hypothetical protein